MLSVYTLDATILDKIGLTKNPQFCGFSVKKQLKINVLNETKGALIVRLFDVITPKKCTFLESVQELKCNSEIKKESKTRRDCNGEGECALCSQSK